MRKLCSTPFLHSLRSFSSTTSPTTAEKIVASVLFERLPVVIPKIDRVLHAFQEFTPDDPDQDTAVVLSKYSTQPAYEPLLKSLLPQISSKFEANKSASQIVEEL
ncbi:hypothetical protein RND81_01G102800 [Saponaria officinalis]|uniref:Uncharacterized protein n=1 Tax=Saponaria officinalis TaxID=3572 RepID=A0AAW1NEI1_SAPOF